MYIGLDTWLHRRLRARLHEQAQGVYGLAVVLPIACKALYIMYLVRGGGANSNQTLVLLRPVRYVESTPDTQLYSKCSDSNNANMSSVYEVLFVHGYYSIYTTGNLNTNTRISHHNLHPLLARQPNLSIIQVLLELAPSKAHISL